MGLQAQQAWWQAELKDVKQGQNVDKDWLKHIMERNITDIAVRKCLGLLFLITECVCSSLKNVVYYCFMLYLITTKWLENILI